MTSASNRQHSSPVARLARRTAAIFLECHYAQQRALSLFMSPERYGTDRDRAPATYAEFLFRTGGTLITEPTACERGRC
jgi:hypothetical protein